MDKEAIRLAAIHAEYSSGSKSFPFQAITLAPGVVPPGVKAPVLAMDNEQINYLNLAYSGAGFAGYPYLSQLATRAEFRAMSNALSSEMTREWIRFNSVDADEDKLKKIDTEFKRLGVQNIIKRAVEHDANFGRAQIFMDIKGADRSTPLIIDPRTIKINSLERICCVEAIWTTPSAYNALDPTAPDFYKPSEWFVLGRIIHASRLLTIITNDLPDMLKPAFNFGGISLYQLAEHYVDNWLRTQQSVADLINNFSITALSTAMDQVLQGGDNGTALFDRIKLFTATRSNKGMMVLDKEREELIQQNVPLGGLHELQAQAQEHMCSVSRMPSIILTGISPGGLNASSDSEIRVFYDWIASQQTACWQKPIETILQVVQLSLFGEIDPTICFEFVPLFQLTDVEKSAIRLQNSQTAGAYVAAGIVSPEEVRKQLANDKDSGFNGIDADTIAEDASVSGAQHRAMEAAAHGHSTLGIPQKVGKEFVSKDEEFKESEHPRDERL